MSILTPSNPTPISNLRERVRSSALWAAYGDALGFQTELATSAQVRSRTGRFPVADTGPWTRRVGGRQGLTVALPAGCVSDDTQLRLAVCRSIGPRGFDAELFAKVELTVWPSYALGAGRGTGVAAANLRRRDTSWATNFFHTSRATYVQGGGNGAAMRIQPHVWSASPHGSVADLLAEVVVDAIVTHGHVRAIIGAGMHALAVRRALARGHVGDPGDWRRDTAELMNLIEIVEDHDELGGLWLGMWRQRSGTEFGIAVMDCIEEVSRDIDALEAIEGDSLSGTYDSAVEAVGAFRAEQRGSGTKTALLGSYLAWRSNGDPREAMLVAANRIGTDTDSIASMLGAVLGAAGAPQPTGELADRGYVVLEADRMAALRAGAEVELFPYPDLRHWQVPRTQSDGLGELDGRFHLVGLGPVEPAGELRSRGHDDSHGWQWVDLWFGQRVLAKRRVHPPMLTRSQVAMPSDAYTATSLHDSPPAASPLPHDHEIHVRRTAHPTRGIHELTSDAIRSGFDSELIGRHMLQLSESEQGVELSVAYAAILAKALISRRESRRR
jgi:ADP-ribosylglycohydrolase